MPIEQLKNLVDYGVIGFLIFLSFIVVTFAIERVLFFRSLKTKNYTSRTQLELDLSAHLSSIASIGTNAPYIGLLGTVLAIIITFYIIGEQGDNINAGEIMKNLALALKATAAGLLVAIPATAIYNALVSKVDKILAQWDIAQESR